MVSFVLMLVITLFVTVMWVIGIDREIQYQKENPEHKPGEGWLDWDQSHTEGEL